MRDLPTGTVTFLFSDIEGSTRLARGLGVEWSRVLTEHRGLLREAFAANGGVEVSTEGDSFFVVFPTAVGAVAAAAAAQRALAVHAWPEGAEVRVRMGVHTTGAAQIADGTYAGVDVHRAARIMSAGHGGQIVLSAATRALVQQALPEGLSLLDLGEHRLKDLPDPEVLAQVAVAGLPTEFPALRSLEAPPAASLPPQATTFIGREEDVVRVRDLLRTSRLVTLTGAGGTGKTRLSLQVASEEASDSRDAVFFVELAAIREPELVLPSIAKAIGVADPGPRPIERIAEHIARERILVVLDNLEQVTEAAADIGELLRQAAGLSLLATSRSALRVYGEQEYPVPPLPMPDPREVPADRGIVRYPAAALFRERARRVKPDFEITDENAQAVAEICWRLDGLPLAIELAAARIRILSPQAMVERLSGRLDLGSGGSRDLPARQQTLRGAIAWSYDILEDDERRFFRAFGVFSGGADLEAVESVLGDYTTDVFGGLGALVDKSLLRPEETPDGAARFRMLETIREFAEERLAAEREEDDALRRAHAHHYLRRAQDDASRIFSQEQKAVLDRAERDHDNLRAALTWATGAGDGVIAMRLLAAAWRMWQMRGYLAEGEDRARRVLEMPGLEDHPAELAAALEAAGGLAYWQGDMDLAEERYERALAIQREIGDDAAVANAIYNLTMSFGRSDTLPITVPPERVALAQEALDLFRRVGDRRGEGNVLWAMLDIEVLRLRSDAALALGEKCLRIFSETGDRFMLAWTQFMLGLNDNLRSDRVSARDRFLSALDSFRDGADVSAYGLVLDGLAALSFADGDREHAMRVAGGADAIQQRAGAHLARLNRQWADFHPELLLDDPALAAAWEEGRAMELDDLLDLAVAGAPAT